MTKYIARASHYSYGTHYRMKNRWSLTWTQDINKAVRFDTENEALNSMVEGVAADYAKDVLVAPEDRIYAAARRRSSGSLYYRSKTTGWTLTVDPECAHEFPTRFEASDSLSGLRSSNGYDFKVGTMDEIQKWYDQFGKYAQGSAQLGDEIPETWNQNLVTDSKAEERKPSAREETMIEFGIDPVVAKYAAELRRIYDARNAGVHTFSGVLHAMLAEIDRG